MKDKVILLQTDALGNGDEQLGTHLLETYFTLLKQREHLPKAIFCMQRGVFALTDQSLASLHIKDLGTLGVEVYACKTCVDYYDVEGKMVVGTISSMAKLIELSEQFEIISLR